MSLILDALRKLERERKAPERGFLVVAHTPWGAAPRWSTWAVIALVLAVGLAASIITATLLQRPWRRATATGAPAPTPSQATVPAAVALTSAPVAASGAPDVTGSHGGPGDNAAALPPSPSPAEPSSDAAAPTPSPRSPDLRLMAVSAQDGVPVAIVNDRLVREGDSFDGIRIVRIGASQVEVEVNGKRRILTF